MTSRSNIQAPPRDSAGRGAKSPSNLRDRLEEIHGEYEDNVAYCREQAALATHGLDINKWRGEAGGWEMAAEMLRDALDTPGW